MSFNISQELVLFRVMASQHHKNSLPQAIEAERALLAALLHDNKLHETVSEFLRQEHFFDPLHGKIYNAITAYINKDQLANTITLWPYFADNTLIQERGGREYFETLTTYLLSLHHTDTYAKEILNAYLRRQLITIGDAILSEAYDNKIEKTVHDQIEQCEQSLFQLSAHYTNEKQIRVFSDVLTCTMKQASDAFSRDSHIIGVETGFVALDKQLGGLHPSDLIILAARPSMGKTALATNIAFQTAALVGKQGRNGVKVAYFSLEMSGEQLVMRILAHESELSSDQIRRGALSKQNFASLNKSALKLQNLPLFIDDTPALTIARLRARARRLKRQENIGLIIIDYLQLLVGGTKTENRVQELSFITRSLKAISKELNIPILALSSLSRAVEQRDDKRPQLQDLRESGTIEMDADVVMFIYRQEYYERRKKPPEDSKQMAEWQSSMNKVHNLAEIIIAKQRHGPINTINLYYHDASTRFYNSDLDMRSK